MSSTSQPTDFSDLYTDLMNRVRVDTGQATTKTQAQRWINIALQDMHLGQGEKFPWAERNEVLRTRPTYSTGTLVATKGSTTITGTSTLWNTNDDFSVTNVRAGGKIVIDAGPEVYEIASVSSDTVAVLNTAWINTTTTVSTYKYFEDEYALHTDFLKPLDAQRFSNVGEIFLIDRKTFRRKFIRNNNPTIPRQATLLTREPDGDTTLRHRIRFAPPPSATTLIPYSFVTNKLAVSSSGTEATNLSADADEPIVPLNYRHAIVFHALYHWYRDQKDDDRTQLAKGEYESIMGRIISDHEIGVTPRPQLRPRISSYKRRARRPYSGAKGGRYVTGSRFDELR